MEWSEANNDPDKWKEFWYNDSSNHTYFMGKDNLPFHAVFYPGQLKTYDENLHLPDKQSVNMFLNFEGKKFSKSNGVSLKIEDLVKKFGNDPVRFYLTAIMPEYNDSSFKWSDFIEKNNSILVNNFGNFINRSLSIGYGTEIEKINGISLDEETKNQIKIAFSESRRFIDNCDFKNYLMSFCNVANYGNKRFDYSKIWVLKKENVEEFNKEMAQHFGLILTLGYLISPIMPESSKKIANMMGFDSFENWPEIGEEIEFIENKLRTIKIDQKPIPLYKRISVDEII